MIKGSLFLLGACALFLVSATPRVWAGGEGSPLIWQSPVTISGDSDVSTTGSLVAAFNMFGSAVAVNGVTFSAFNVTGGSQTATNGNFSFSESPGILTPSSSLGSASAPFSNLSANYRTLLSTAISTSDNNTLTLTMTGLTLGLTYQFQWWVNASNFNPNIGFDTTATSGPQVVTLDSNTTNANGGVGQMVIGTFFAGANFQTIAFTGTSITQAPTVNAFQLRVIPEPGTLALFAVGAAGLAALLRQRRRTL
jgi:hypothetical protein